MRLVFAGTPDVALPSLAALLESAHEVVAVVTRPDAPRGRSKTPVPSPVARWAAENQVPALKPVHPRGPEFVEQLRTYAPDCCPVVAYGALLPRQVLALPAHGWINLHFSLLPAWRGAAPVQRAIMNGDSWTGATVFQLVEELDAGPIYGQIGTPISDTDTSGDLLAKLAEVGAALLVRVLDDIAAGRATPVPQPTAGISSAPKISTDDAHLDWTWPATRLRALVHACNPAPGAWTMLDNTRVKILRARATTDQHLAPGALSITKSEVRVGTGSGDLILEQVQPMGRPIMNAADWGRGFRTVPERFSA